MPPTSATAEQLRQRAVALRVLSSIVGSTAALDLHRRAGDDVWQGPTPSRCLDDLLRIRTDLLAAADDLTDGARVLDQRATQLEVQAAADIRP